MSGLESMSENNTKQDVLIQADRAIISTYNFFQNTLSITNETELIQCAKKTSEGGLFKYCFVAEKVVFLN